MKKCIGCFRLIESHCYNPFILWKSDDVPNWAEAALVEVFEVGCMLFTACLAWSGKDCGSDNIEVSVPIVLKEFDTAGKKQLNYHQKIEAHEWPERLDTMQMSEIGELWCCKIFKLIKISEILYQLRLDDITIIYKQYRPGRTDQMW